MPSLRANGSRECAPDDRLREAIHFAATQEVGLLRRFRLRSLSYGGQVAPRNDDIDRNTPPRSRGAMRPSFYKNRSPKENRGRRESRVLAAPAASRAKLNKAHERSHHRFRRIQP